MPEGLAIMTSGGDSAGMNPAVKCAADYAKQRGYETYLVYDGLRGLLADRIVPATPDLTVDMLHRGGTLLRSSRSPEFFDIEQRRRAYENLQRRGVGKLIVIGGDGSFRALNQFYADFGVPFAGIPATIDNDIAGTDYCLGVDTALNIIREAIDSIRDTASSFRRAFVIEVMGRHCGYLALTSALACGADVCLVPEMPYNLDTIAARLKHDLEQNGRTYAIAVVAEGTKMADYLTRYINDSVGMEARLTVLGHIQRGGSPTVLDRMMAHKFAVAAVDALEAGQTNSIMVYRDGTYGHLPIQIVADSKYRLDSALLKLASPLSC
ncbi:MAG: ATP-dependent 6-phosphofructokinase [Verrucomicrobiaceae bacterium]|nr:MAG: ATP-dependent 6-phosphofructokinase [Verrucomicrobiaceae bacterium]